MKIKRIAATAAALVAFAGLSGCGSPRDLVDTSRLAEAAAGESTSEVAVEVLEGQPYADPNFTLVRANEECFLLVEARDGRMAMSPASCPEA